MARSRPSPSAPGRSSSSSGRATSGSCSSATPTTGRAPADLSRVTFRYIPEFSARLAALLAGEIDIMKDVPPLAVEQVDRSGKARVRATVSSRINYLALVNLKPGPMQDLRVRRRCNHAVTWTS